MEPLKTSLVSEEQTSTEIDDRHYSLQAKQEDIQKRTFTSWVNSQLEKHPSPSLILDLYSDIGKGHVLLDLLEVLSGQQLSREKGSNTFQRRSNIENALTFLKNRSLKLINIHVADIIEGKPSIVLGLIWIIILHFHIEELAKALSCGYSHSSLDSPSTGDLSPAMSPTARTNVKAKERWKISAKKAVLLWAKEQCDKHGSINVADFKSSWRNGLAFLAIIHALRPGLVDVEKAKERSNKENLREAFQVAEKELGIPRLLEPEDVDVISPDEKSIMTYVAQFLQYFKSLPVAEDRMQEKIKETLSWLNAQECKLTKLLTELENASFYRKFEAMLSFTEAFNEEKKRFLPILESKRKGSDLNEDYLEMKEAWDNLSHQMNEWKAKLDNMLPPPLDAIEAWLKETEQHLVHNLPISQDHLKATAALEEKLRAVQNLMESFQQHLETLQSFDNRDNAGMLVVPPQKLEEMRKRFSKVQLENFSIIVEYYCSSSSAVFNELTSKLNIWHIKFGTKETVELLQLDWHNFIEEKGFPGQLDTALQVCEAQKNKMIKAPNLEIDPEEIAKLFKMTEVQVAKCREYINNVNDTLKKVLSSWAIYMENIQLLKPWLEETRKDHLKKISPETLAAWNSRHGSLNEAGNFLIESSNAEVGSSVSGELKKLNRKWAKLIKKTKFEMKLLRMQEEETMLITDNNGTVETSRKSNPDMFSNPVEPSKELPKMCFEKAEIVPISLQTDPCTPDEFSSEDEDKLNFEKAHKELETIVLKAMHLVGQKTISEEPRSKYEEAFSILDTNILSKFLKAAEQLKSILSAHEKALVEERSKDVCERWEAARCEIMSYIHLKLKIEREKFNKTFSNLNKQIKKEKKLLNSGKTKGLIEEHEAFFSQQGSLGELNTCLQALKTMSDKITKVEKESKIKLPIAEYEQKEKELQKCAATIYNELVSRTGDDHSPEKGEFTSASVNEEKVSSQNPEAEKDSEDVSCIKLESEKELQNGRHHTEKLESDGDLALKKLKESYDAARHNLKLHLKSIRETITPSLTDDVRNISSLKNKLQTLEALESKGNSSWKLFDSVASQLVKFSSEMDLEDLHKEWDELQFALDKRMESLKAALALVMPIENEWVLLCRSEEQLCKRDIPRFVMSKTDLLYKKVKKIQASISNCIEQCNSQELKSPAGWTIDQRDRQAIGLMISEYKIQLEELSQKIQAIETVLQDFESFLASLRRIQCSMDASTSLSWSPQSMEEVSHLEKEAKSLDEKLKQLHIYLVEAESDKKIGCEEFVAALLVKEFPSISSEATQSQKTEEFSLRNNELFKNLQDIYDSISVIGLKDPTIPAISQRLKLLDELWKKLDRCAPEMKALNEISQFSQLPKAQENEVSQQWKLTQDLWKKTKVAITEKREYCKSTMELLKQYQSCKTCLTSIILKQENALSQQVSYMGKENLQKIIAKVNMAKEEFNSYSEDVDRLNQMCKNLQSQVNKMKSFEEPPFENEANAIVDRWLDINERTESYCENLERALALWDKLLDLSSLIDEWSDAVQKNLEDGNVTEKKLEELEADVLFQEKELEKFDTQVDEIQDLLNSSEPPLELQVIKSSLLNKMELIRKYLPNKSEPTELKGSTTELKGDLDLAKSQIGMTESLLEALSPSDTLEIFTKLEEIHQKILHQKQHVKLLQKETGYLNPDVIELKKLLTSITDLFNSKKQIFQDHFITLLNYQCKRFDDWFSNVQISLEECFDSSETKEMAEKKIHQLISFLNFEDKGSDIDEVKTIVNQVKNYLPKPNVHQLNNWVRDQEVELQRIISKCQARKMELHYFLQQFARLEKDFKSLQKWLRTQEEKWKQVQKEKTGLEHFYQILLKQREWFDSFDCRANYLKNSGFFNDEAVLESAQFVSKYKRLVNHVQKTLGVSEMYCVERKHFEELVRNIFCWMEILKKPVLEMSAEESEIPLEERLFKIQEIALLKVEGNAKLQTIITVGEHLKCDDKSKNLAIEQIVSDVHKKWDSTIHLVIGCLRDQEQLQHQMEHVKQTEDAINALFYEVEKQKQGLNVDILPNSQQVQSQLNNYSALLKEIEGLTLLLNELTKQRNSLEICTNSFSAESLMALQHLYKCLLCRLQNTTKLLEGSVEGHQQCEELKTLLITSLEELWEPMGAEQNQVQYAILCQAEDRLQEVVALMDSISLEQTCVKDDIDAPQIKPKHLKTKYGLEHETEDIHCDILKDKKEMDNETTNREKLVISSIPFAPQEENPLRVKNQLDREAPELFPEWFTNKVQLPSSLALGYEERAAAITGQELKGNLMEAHNFQSSASQCVKQRRKSEQILADDYPNESPQQQQGYQKKLQATCAWSEMPQTILPLMNGKQGYLEDQAIAEYAKLEQKINKVKIWTAELDIVLMKDQLREMEDLCLQLEKKKAQALSVWPEHSTVAEESQPNHQGAHSVTSSSWDRLLQELMAAKEAKQNQFNLVNRYHECLATVQSSMKHLLAEKEKIYTRGPVEDTVLLENLNKLLASLQKENSLLDKLKTEQENLSRHLSTLDRELVQSQVDQAEQWWKQMGDCLQKKQFCVAAEMDEFKLFMDKAEELQRCLQQQHDLQTGLSAPGTEEHPCPISIPLELHILKRNISLLKRNAEVQMKRMWSNPGKTALDNTINDLQSQVEELEQITPKENVQITDSHPQIYEIRKEIEDAILGNKILMHHLDERAALFPDDLLSQIKCCKAVISDAKEKEPTFIRLADEAQHVASHMPSKENSALSILSHELQTGYQFLILKSSQKLQQLEFQLGKREKLFANIEKFEAQLQKIVAASSLDIDKTNIKSEFDHMQNLLEKIPKKVQEMEALVDANCKDSSEGLNTFEQLFLNDCLKSLRSRAKRAHRVIQIKGRLAQHKMGAYQKFSEEIRALQQDLSNFHFDELELSPDELLSKNQAIKDKLNMFKERTLAIQSRLSYLDQYQEFWKWLDPKWDTSPLVELKNQFCKAKDNLDKRAKYLKNLFAEHDRHQIVLSEIEAIVSSIQKECGDLKDLTSSTPEANLILGKKLMWRVEHAKYITQEAFKLFKKNKSFSVSLKKANMQQIKSLDAKIDGLEQITCSVIVANQEICKYKQGFQSKLGHSLRTLKQIQSEFQQPVLLDLKIQMIPYEMMYCKVLKGAIEAEIHSAEDIITKEKSSTKQICLHSESLDKEIEEFQNLKIQLKADFAKYTEALDEAFKMVKLYNKAVEKSADLLSQCEAFLSIPLLDLPKLEESHLDFAKKQEESESAKAEVEALTSTLKKSIKSKAKLQMEKTLDDLTAKNLTIKEQSQKRNSYIQRYMEKYHSFKNSKERICDELNNAEKVLWKYLYYIPVSYKDSLEHSEQSKMLLSQLLSTKEELMRLRRDSQALSLMCKENDGGLIVPIVSMLWLKWLCLFNITKEWEGKCEEQNQEWKSVSEELERETIILDSLQEELPESVQDKQQATKEELEEFLESASNYIENLDTEKLLLRLILCRLRYILSVPGSSSGKESLPIICEIQNMQQRTEELCQKAQTEKEATQFEMAYRTECSEELKAMKTSLQGIISQLCGIDLETPTEKALKLEEIQRVVDSKKQIMDNLQTKFTELYRTVPVGIEGHLEDCKEMLRDLEEKVSTEFLKNSPHYNTEKKIEDINKGLQAIENMLHQKSENIAKAKEVQKRIWDLIDLWHYKMNELDSEVQDIVEQNPHQAQELLDRLMIPLQRYQHVSQHAERRTTNLNRAASKLEECDELLKSIKVWLENTSRLLTEEVKSDSAKALNKHASALEMALEDSQQKQSILSAISPELKELSPLIETDNMVQELTEVNEQVKALQQKIMEILPCIQHLADDVEAIESEVKTMEKDIEKIKTILSPSEDTLDLSPKEHLKHCKVILTHICPMKKAVVEMQSYKAKLRLTDMRMQPLSVFQRTKQLLKELKVLERLTEKQNTLLEPIVKEIEEFEQRIDFLKQSQFPKSNLDELPSENLWPVQDHTFLKVLENQLAVKSKEVDQLKNNLAALKDCADAAKKIGFTITNLAEMRTSIINQVAQLKSSTESALECWKTYDEVWDEIRLMLANAAYCLEHSKNPFITMKSLKKQVEDLQSLQDKAERNKEIWARLQTAADNLKKVCDPSFSEIIEQKHEEARTRWILTNQNIEETLQKARAHLNLWGFYTELSAKLDKCEEQYDSQLMPDTVSSCTMDILKEKAENIKRLQLGLQDIKEYYLQASKSGDSITLLAEPETQNLLQEKFQPLQRISYLEKMLQMKADVYQYGLLQMENFGNSLEKLENHVKNSTEILDNSCENNKNLELLMSQLLSLTSLSPEMERLNEVSFRLPLCDFTVKRLQNLNRQWTQKTALVLEQCSELQKDQSDDKNFLQQCQNWVQFLERMKESLKENMPATLEKLQEQQKEYEILQTEISINQQIFSCLVSKALNMLDSEEAENRTEFISRLTLLKEQWQSAMRMAHRKKIDIDSLVKQWQKFTTLLQDLTKFLMDTSSYIAAVKSQEKYRLDQIRNLNHKFKNKKILQKRWQTRYSLILETGEKLLGMVAPEAKAAMQLEMNKLRVNWDNTQFQLEKITRQFQDTIQTWENCESQVKDLGHVLLELKGSINKPLPIEHDALPATLEQVKVLEKALTNWSQNAKELDAQKVKLAQFILPEDVMVLREQTELLHSQWEELCLRVSLHKQDIEEQLNAWIVFNEKNKELCTWLMQMEEKVPQSADISIEDMIDKLQKDYMEEINLFNESQLVHFKQMGNQLIKSSNQSRGAEIEEKLNKINDRWQHLFDIIGGRVKKLKDTFAFIQQLDKNMSHLHTWLARIESELSKPIVYDICDDQEIQRRLAEQQDLQRDIEQHTAGVESVFNICEILLHDSDACANETECDSIQQTTRSLERRWRNICAMSIERRMKIEATWRLWQKFLEDYSRFEVWLKTAEKTAAYPNSSEILYVTAKEELKKFEAFQRQIHERLTQLELINKQYRRLARENRTDSANKLKQMVYEGNHRWDNLQKRVTAILRRLKHFTSQWEEFMGTKDNIILVWLTEMDLQLTNVEHFSKSDFDDKMRQLNGFQREIMLNTSKIDQLIASGLYLIQKSEPEDAIILEEELEEFYSYCQEVFGRVARFHQRLISWHPGLEDEKESSENEADSDHARGMEVDPWPKKIVPEGPPSQQSLCHLIPTAGGPERSGCETPVSVDSIPLEWDHTGDVGGSSSPEDEEEDSFFSALSDVEITEHPEAYLKMTTKALKAASGKSAETHIWHPSEHPVCRKHSYNQEEMVRSVLSNNEDSSTSYKPGNVIPLSTRSVDDIKDISRILPSKDSQNSQNFISVSGIEKQPGTIERWELLQVQDLSNKLRMKQTWQQWQQLNADLTNIDIWLDKMEEEMEGLQEEEPQPVNSIQAIDQRVKKLKDMLKAYNNYKALVLSVNLTSKDFKQTDSTGYKELQNRLRRVNLRWEKANILLENWKKNLQKALIHCQDFHEQNQKLLLWLAAAETRRHQAQVKEPNADPHRIQESRKELMQLEKELLERQLQVNNLQEIAEYLLVKPDGEKYIEANEKVHVIGKKLKQLLEGVSCDLKASQGRQDVSTFQVNGEELDSGSYHQLSEKSPISKNKVDEKKILQSNTSSNVRMGEKEETNSFAPKKHAFFCRVLRAALPLQLFLLLLLFLASLIPVSEEDYSCTQTNNFARSFYPMLRYINGPPPI
ncbi:nesprin-2 [Pseudonaja textilis]|uniref:nesprin-2 n=1 Tax=Pseudonaja textilis TaxID=8673 RepID=UPI000EA8BF2E|nr:nesprin-2 [Pseudonaja textilis]